MKKFIKITISCMLGAFITATAYVVTFSLSLPVSDGANGQLPFQDPLVFPVMSLGALISGIAVAPFIYYTLQNRNIKRCLYLILPAVLICVIASTAINAKYSFIMAFASLALSTILCIFLGIGKKESIKTEQRH